MTPLKLTPAQEIVDRLAHEFRHGPPTRLADMDAEQRTIYRVALEQIRDLDVDAPYDYAAFAKEMQRIASIALDKLWESVTPHCSHCVADAERVAHCPRCDTALIHARIDTGHGNRIEGEACPGCGWSYEPELDTSRKETP